MMKVLNVAGLGEMDMTHTCFVFGKQLLRSYSHDFSDGKSWDLDALTRTLMNCLGG